MLMVNHIARGLVPEWFTWTTIQLSCSVRTHPHQHHFDATTWSTVFSTWQHLGGEIWVEEGGVRSRGTPGRGHCADGIYRARRRYSVDEQPVVLRSGACTGANWESQGGKQRGRDKEVSQG